MEVSRIKLITKMGHFWIEFDNGYTLSVFNGFGSHTENGSSFSKMNEIREQRDIYAAWESETVEIGILKDGELVTDCFGYNDTVTTLDLYEMIELINKLKDKE